MSEKAHTHTQASRTTGVRALRACLAFNSAVLSVKIGSSCVGAHGRWFNVKRLCQQVALVLNLFRYSPLLVPVCDFKTFHDKISLGEFYMRT